MRALPQRLHGSSAEAELDTVRAAVSREHAFAAQLEPRKPHLPDALPLGLQPVVVPVRQEVRQELGLVPDVARRLRVGVPQFGEALPDVDPGRAGQPQVGLGRREQRRRRLPQPLNRRAQVRVGTLPAGVGPQRAGSDHQVPVPFVGSAADMEPPTSSPFVVTPVTVESILDALCAGNGGCPSARSPATRVARRTRGRPSTGASRAPDSRPGVRRGLLRALDRQSAGDPRLIPRVGWTPTFPLTREPPLPPR